MMLASGKNSRPKLRSDSNYDALLEEKFAALESRVTTQFDEVIKSLKKENQRLKEEVCETKKQLVQLERDVIHLQ